MNKNYQIRPTFTIYMFLITVMTELVALVRRFRDIVNKIDERKMPGPAGTRMAHGPVPSCPAIATG